MAEQKSAGRTARKMADWTELSYAVVDVEGNGHQPPDLVELAAVPIIGGVIGEPMSWLIRPDQAITPMAQRVHGISNKAVADAPLFADIKDDVLKALGVSAFVAHNAHVDANVLRRKMPGWTCPEVFDTLKLARRFVPDQMSFRLGSLVEALQLAEGLPHDMRPHRAGYDALVTARLFVQLATVAGSLEELRGLPPEGGTDETPALF
ncbi:exonuclease domain-containing protein [Streptomyces sp. PTY087I2]|uniref:3'-5' exonuclease n=1 Tax=Streptomyces sp. PTY087I2 TaxID=1819298 RepID=UPI000828FD71|nr:exonuclease domain-containing protein [Streptomyces sp. PTY087I2]OCC09546.1 Exodeoxyribonuclease 10 [Streptomyces sp. PTY087I2]